MKPRTTVLGLMGVVLLFAVGMAALRLNDEVLTAGVFAATFAALGVGALFAIYRRGAWAGFAIFGWAVFLICQPQTAPAVGPTSLVMGVVVRLIPRGPDLRFPRPSFRLDGYPAISSDIEGRPGLIAVSGGSATMQGDVPVHSLRAFLCLSCLISGGLGTGVGRWVEWRCKGPLNGRAA
jgi:hypothetical protein